MRAGLQGNGQLNGAECALSRNVFADKDQKLLINSGIRFSALAGKYEAVNELAIRNKDNALEDQLNSFEAVYTGSANLFIGMTVPVKEKWAFRAEGDLIGIGFGTQSEAAFVSGEALKSSRPQFASETNEVKEIRAQQLNLFVPITRSRGSLTARVSADYTINNQHTLSIGMGTILRGLETPAPIGAKGSSYFRQTSYLPYIGYVWNMKKGK